MARVDMGEDYAHQIFFDFATGQSVMTSEIDAWDLAFEATPEGYHVFMNGGKDVFLYNTHLTDPASVTETNAYNIDDADWGFDDPGGLPDGTYVSDWRQGIHGSKNEVFILKFNDGSFKKFVIKSVCDTSYTFQYGDINSVSLSNVVLPKDPVYNYIYFSFEGGGMVYPEPPKNSYDIVFTRYRYIYYELDNIKYAVNGVLLNPYKTTAVADSSHKFEDITFSNISMLASFAGRRDVIGFDWKQYNFTTSMYETRPDKVYVVKTRNNEYWKLHFLDFYNTNGVKGSPSFEFERIQ